MLSPEAGASRGSSLTDSAELSPVEQARRAEADRGLAAGFAARAARVEVAKPRRSGGKAGRRKRSGSYQQAPKQVADPLGASLGPKHRCQLAGLGLLKGKASQPLAVRHTLAPLHKVAAAKEAVDREQSSRETDLTSSRSRSSQAAGVDCASVPPGTVPAEQPLQDQETAYSYDKGSLLPGNLARGPLELVDPGAAAQATAQQPLSKQQQILQKLHNSLPAHLKSRQQVCCLSSLDTAPYSMPVALVGVRFLH